MKKLDIVKNAIKVLPDGEYYSTRNHLKYVPLGMLIELEDVNLKIPGDINDCLKLNTIRVRHCESYDDVLRWKDKKGDKGGILNAIVYEGRVQFAVRVCS